MKTCIIMLGILFTLSYCLTIGSDNYSTLMQLTDAPIFTLDGNTYMAKIVDIYDGDSLKAVINICDDYYKFSFRLDGIDTPQVRSGVVRDFGYEVRDILRDMILGKIVKIIAGQADKYGRVLGVIYAQSSDGNQVNINQYLVDYGMAKSYDGGTKDQFTQADYDYFIQNYRDTQWPSFVHYPNN